ncbi:MAG TPA: AI-2E family transporter [Ignavibacteriaceae bacterium]|nr:AI-2E family transporter [Ignavibacteriaceae bacterium]
MLTKEPNNYYREIHFLIGAAALVIILAGINLAQSVVVLFLLAFFLALLGAPSVLWLKKKRIPSGIAVFIVMAAMISILILFSAQIGSSISSFTDELPLLQIRINEQISDLVILLSGKGIAVNEKIFLEYINPESIMSLTAVLLSGLSSVLSDTTLILLTVTFILLEVSNFPVKLRAVLGDPKQVFPEFTKFANDMKRYMVIKTLISIFTGVLVGLWLLILGVDYPVLWGFLAFLLNYIPNIGSIIASIPPIILALIQNGVGSAVLTMSGYLVINIIVGNILEPKLMGRRLNLSTLVVFVSMIFWGSLLGIIGAILSIPLTMTLKFAFERNDRTRWIAMLLESENISKYSVPTSEKTKAK